MWERNYDNRIVYNIHRSLRKRTLLKCTCKTSIKDIMHSGDLGDLLLSGKARKNTGHHSNQVLILPIIGTKWLLQSQTRAQTMPTIIYIQKRWRKDMNMQQTWWPKKVQIKQRFMFKLLLLSKDYCQCQFRYNVYRKEALLQWSPSHQTAKISTSMNNV